MLLAKQFSQSTYHTQAKFYVGLANGKQVDQTSWSAAKAADPNMRAIDLKSNEGTALPCRPNPSLYKYGDPELTTFFLTASVLDGQPWFKTPKAGGQLLLSTTRTSECSLGKHIR